MIQFWRLHIFQLGWLKPPTSYQIWRSFSVPKFFICYANTCHNGKSGGILRVGDSVMGYDLRSLHLGNEPTMVRCHRWKRCQRFGNQIRQLSKANKPTGVNCTGICFVHLIFVYIYIYLYIGVSMCCHPESCTSLRTISFQDLEVLRMRSWAESGVLRWLGPTAPILVLNEFPSMWNP